MIGWSSAEGLLDFRLDKDDFRSILHSFYHKQDVDYRKSGSAAGNMWRFIREMRVGDLVVVPHGVGFYVAKVTGPALYDSSMKHDDTASRRPVVWLNDKRPIPRSLAKPELRSRMRPQITCIYATDLLMHVKECLKTGVSEPVRGRR